MDRVEREVVQTRVRPTIGEPSDDSRAEISDPLSLPWAPLRPNRHTESCLLLSRLRPTRHRSRLDHRLTAAGHGASALTVDHTAFTMNTWPRKNQTYFPTLIDTQQSPWKICKTCSRSISASRRRDRLGLGVWASLGANHQIPAPLSPSLFRDLR